MALRSFEWWSAPCSTTCFPVRVTEGTKSINVLELSWPSRVKTSYKLRNQWPFLRELQIQSMLASSASRWSRSSKKPARSNVDRSADTVRRWWSFDFPLRILQVHYRIQARRPFDDSFASGPWRNIKGLHLGHGSGSGRGSNVRSNRRRRRRRVGLMLARQKFQSNDFRGSAPMHSPC